MEGNKFCKDPCKYFDTEMILIVQMISFLYDDLEECCGGLCHIVTDDDNIEEHSLTEFKTALEDSKEADEILLARANFADSIDIGGYKRISQFDTSFSADGCTALYDTIVEGKKKLMDYREFLRNEGMRVKAVFAIFSDGEDTASSSRFAEAKEAIEDLNNKEITTAFISFGGGADKEATGLKFRNILNVASSASELRKAFNCLSKSVIESSKSVVDDGDDFFKVD